MLLFYRSQQLSNYYETLINQEKAHILAKFWQKMNHYTQLRQKD